MPYRRTETFPGADHGGQQKICLKRHEMKDLSKKNGGIIAVERNRMG